MEILELQHKSTLARLLAKENITVVHDPKADTAMFDVLNRNLILPVWKNMGMVVYDMLIAHEVGHALYTFSDDIEKFTSEHGTRHFGLLNVIEDVRIERLVQNLYPSLPRIFHSAYKNLVDADFFKLHTAGKIEDMTFVNRLNLHAKIGKHKHIPLSDEERTLYDECYSAETWDDVLVMYHKILNFIAEKKSKPEPVDSKKAVPLPDPEDLPPEDDSEGSAPLPDAEDFTPSPDSEDSTPSPDPEDSTPLPDSGMVDQEDTAVTTNDEFEKSLIDKASWPADRYRGVHPVIMHSNKQLLKFVTPYKELFENHIKKLEEPFFNPYTAQITSGGLEVKTRTKKKGSILANVFERKKAAFEYSRGRESRKGTINPNKLYSYKIKDDIFSSLFEKYDSKSHGMIFFIDFSASMYYQFYEMLEHTLNLVHFCKKVGIPFRVFSFTTNHNANRDERVEIDKPNIYRMSNVGIVEHFSSEMPKKIYEMAYNRFCMGIADREIPKATANVGLLGTSLEYMEGTPLQSTLLVAHAIVDEFRKKHSVQKLNVIFLTDGDSAVLRRAEADSSRWSGQRGHDYITVKNKTHKIAYGYQRTPDFVKFLGKAKGVKTIGYYLPNTQKDLKYQLNTVSNRKKIERGKLNKMLKKNNVVECENHLGYDQYFVLPVDVSLRDDEFDFGKDGEKGYDDIASSTLKQRRMARDFAAHNRKRNNSKVLLEQFAQSVS